MINKCIIFTSRTCKDCFALSRNYTSLEEQFPNIIFEYIDVIDHPNLGEIHNIYSVPSLELYEKGIKVAEFKHGSSKTYKSIVNFIKVHETLRKGKKW